MFAPQNSQQTARYGLSPFSPMMIPLGPNIDRSQGVLISEEEAMGFYVEQCDYPVQVALVNAGYQERQMIILRDGQVFKGSFKGMYLMHPSMNQAGNLRLILFKSPDADFRNELATPISRNDASTAVIVDTAAQQESRLFVPVGCRAVTLRAFLSVSTTVASGVSDATWDQRDSTPTTITAPTFQQQTGGSVLTYTGRAYRGMSLSVNNISPGATGAVTAWMSIDFGKIRLHSLCREIRVIINGALFNPGSLIFDAMWE